MTTAKTGLTTKKKNSLLSGLPSVASLQQHPEIIRLCEDFPEKYVTKCLRQAVDAIRQTIIKGSIRNVSDIPAETDIVNRTETLVRTGIGNKLMRSVNGTGVILHTGLGRAPLPPSAQEALMEAATRYCVLATDRQTGKRGDRNSHLDELLREITGAESSLVVNNNSAAVILALNTFGEGRESIVSRGELVEIGGAFRVPDVMRRSGTTMIEVGTTNKTHLRDYREAITEATSVLLKVHTSNYRIEGFHKEVTVKDIADLAHEHDLIEVMDLGSGAMVDLRRWNLPYEPTVQETITAGADIVTFSGDKMLGGPQCGVIVGRKKLIDHMKVNPLMRAFRCDKLTLSALGGTLKLFLDPDRLPQTHPVYTMLTAPLQVVNRRARRIARMLRETLDERFVVEITDGATEMGSGSLPARTIPSRIVAISSISISADKLALKLRLAVPPVFTRIEEDRVIIDARTVADDEIRMIRTACRQVLEEF